MLLQRISARYFWIFVKTSHEMYFTKTNQRITKKIVLFRVYSGSWLSQSIIAFIYGLLSFGSFNCHHVIKLSSRQFRNFIICHNLCTVLFSARHSIRHFTRPPRLEFFSSANVLQIAHVALRVVYLLFLPSF